MLKTIWEDNKKFILLSGGGLVVFLFLNSFIAGYVGGADRTIQRCRTLQKNVRLLHRDVADRFSLERNRARSYATHRETLQKEVCLPPDAEVAREGKGRSRSGALVVEFNQAITDAWAKVQAEANQRGLELPKKPTAQDFDVRRDDGPEHYKLHYSNLAICARALEILVHSGVRRFLAVPEILGQEEQPVAENEDLVCLYRGCSYRVAGTYETFLEILEAAQEPGKFLQVRLRRLEPGKGAEEGLLRGELEFIGFRVEEVSGAS